MSQYDEIKKRVADLEPPGAESEYEMRTEIVGKLAYGRGYGGSYVICFLGADLNPSSDRVKQYLHYSDSWRSEGGGSDFEGSLLTFPESEEFSAVVAMIAMECIDAGIESWDMAHCLPKVEPIIELVLSQPNLPGSFVVGLYGELFVLRAVMTCMKGAMGTVSDPTGCWKGAERSARDFSVDCGGESIGIEVKTTLGNSSRHTISGLDQVELQVGDGEEKLYLASIGIQKSPGGESIAGLTDNILDLIKSLSPTPTDDQNKFLDRLKSYGPSSTQRYDHVRMKDEQPFSVGYDHHFNRLYDMGDRNIEIIRSECVKKRRHVEHRGISYKISLEDKIPDSRNPVEPIIDQLRRHFSAP